MEKFTESLNQVMTANEKITSELLIVKNVNINVENRIVNLEKLQAKSQPYSERKNVKISGLSKRNTLSTRS